MADDAFVTPDGEVGGYPVQAVTVTCVAESWFVIGVLDYGEDRSMEVTGSASEVIRQMVDAGVLLDVADEVMEAALVMRGVPHLRVLGGSPSSPWVRRRADLVAVGDDVLLAGRAVATVVSAPIRHMDESVTPHEALVTFEAQLGSGFAFMVTRPAEAVLDVLPWTVGMALAMSAGA